LSLPLLGPPNDLLGSPFLASDFAEDSFEERFVPGTPFLLSDLAEGSFEERFERGLLLFFAVSRPKPEARLERADSWGPLAELNGSQLFAELSPFPLPFFFFFLR